MFFNTRINTISALIARPRWKRNYLKPKITICGNWLQNAGFEVGEKVEIEVYKNKIILKPLKNGN
ncbi:SymE family type I addiction module toxin [uncultured Flavobacterium sp.]|jgi:hypothetical protein|uniref:SymE family type I addiction module toxin n=1 Tax=uncultured Flavobacterium sp. TaxID=165435 RepID=UPI0030EC1069|tara:strand:- start:4930 stop:5124 length:195 start_codon:yes stop_codon:yes gene_type:complete